jgi:tRNA-Thr(GGU) m(6)t(6)A37 methyltransferase TsaA
MKDLTFHPIGVVRSPFVERAEAPRQPYAAGGAEGTIELLPGHDFEHALEDLDAWDRLWVLFAFHLNADKGWKPKVLPPRSEKKRGVFSTRSPHRPNPIGMSVVRLLGVGGLVLRVADLDILDGTPVLDLKPYVPYADAFPDAKTGWLDTPRDPDPGFSVEWDARATAQLAWLRDAHAIELREPIARVLSLGPQPHPYRRIRKDGGGFRLALKDWRVRFRIEGRRVIVASIATGYRERQLATEPALEAHRAFDLRFGRSDD